MKPTLIIEQSYGGIIIGVDEVGRGCLAGPVIAAAVILPTITDIVQWMQPINDSKIMSAKMREKIAADIHHHCEVSIGRAEVSEIEELNILQASLLAMQRAVTGLKTRAVTAVLVDGNKAPKIDYKVQTVIDGDAKSISIAAASIVAKVARDQEMTELAKSYPIFGWEKNAGYGTAHHRNALNANTITPHHRRTFKPIQKILATA